MPSKALKDYRAGKDKESNLKVLEKDMKYFWLWIY